MLKEKSIKKKYLDSYLAELNALTNTHVVGDKLLPIGETQSIPEVVKKFVYKTRTKFDDKENFKIYINQLKKIKNGKAYLFTEYSKYCGALKIDGLQDFNSDFRFSDEHAGILSIVLEDGSNELLLDYYEESGIDYLEIETYGKEWSSVKY